jgi:hypothetical protein
MRHMRGTGNWDACLSTNPLNITDGTSSPPNTTALTGSDAGEPITKG